MTQISARTARVFWNPDGDVRVEPLGSGNKHRDLKRSGGACYEKWQNASTSELKFLMLQTIWEMVLRDRVDPLKVHEAFKAIPEYCAILPEDHPDCLPYE